MVINEFELGPNPTDQEKMWKVLLESQQYSAMALQRLVLLEKDPARRQIFRNVAKKLFEAVEELEKLA